MGRISTYPFVKRSLDVVFSILLLLLLSPVLLFVSALVLLTMGPPVLFRQQRPGHGGRPFLLYKFRTMRTSSREDVDAVSSDRERLTKTGQFLRRTSLDELPELWNILRGDMSFVGPRPLLVSYLSAYTPFQARRHEVRPGLTGLAQVSGRNELSWEERFKLDVYYVDNMGPLLDLRILARTLAVVLSRKGVAGEGASTMEPFVKE